MANRTKRSSNPTITALANFLVFGSLGYYLMGHNEKALKMLIFTIVFYMIGGLGLIIAALAAIDGMEIAKAIKTGEEIGENEYKNEILFRIVKIIDKSAVCKSMAI